MTLTDRFRSVRHAAIVFAIGAAIVGPVASGAAQDATATPDVPTAQDCDVSPVDVSTLLSSAGAADLNSPLFTTQPVAEADLPQGPAATDEELEGVTGTVRNLVACANALDPLRILALISERYTGELASAALAAQQQPELAEQLLTRFPVPLGAVDSGEPVAMIPVRDARLLPDGRVGVILEAEVPSAGGAPVTALFFVAFVDENDRWLVDEVTPMVSAAFATPAP